MDPRRLLPLLAALAACCVVATVALTLARPGPASNAGAGTRITSTSSLRSEAGSILAAWDGQRADAWAAGDVGALRELYAAESQAGAVDARLLQRYVDRGLRVTGLRTQVLSLKVLDQGSHRLRLEVTDRILAGVAVGVGERVTLPSDRASTRRIRLVEVGTQWLVAEVRDQASAAARTSRTSSSSKS